MATTTLTEDMALRIGLAARTLPDTDPARLLRVLADLVGLAAERRAAGHGQGQGSEAGR
jgi:hypothetical protein